jgi:hypothetical protein
MVIRLPIYQKRIEHTRYQNSRISGDIAKELGLNYLPNQNHILHEIVDPISTSSCAVGAIDAQSHLEATISD